MVQMDANLDSPNEFRVVGVTSVLAACVHASGWVGVQSSRILINSFHKNAKANRRGLEYWNAFIVSSTGVQLYILHAAKTLCATLYYTGFRFLQDWLIADRMSFDLGGRDQKVKSSKASKLSTRTGMTKHEHTQIRRRIGFLNLHKNSGAPARVHWTQQARMGARTRAFLKVPDLLRQANPHSSPPLAGRLLWVDRRSLSLQSPLPCTLIQSNKPRHGEGDNWQVAGAKE